MKKVILKSLILKNFRRAENVTIEFDSEYTDVSGENETGKTTIYDAFSWLLYNKNSKSQSDFNIKRLDKNNKVIHNLDHEVTGILIVDGEEKTLKKVLRENWTKKRGSETAELTGNSIAYFIDDVPKSATEYKIFVDSILNEELSKMITNPLYFNDVMKWEERRKVLQMMAGTITSADILPEIEGNKAELIQLLSEGKNLADEKKRLAAKRKTIKEELDLIPSRLDENLRNIPEEKNWEEIEFEIDSKKKRIEELEEKIENKSSGQKELQNEISQKENEKFELEQKLTTLKNEALISANREINEIKVQISALENQKKSKDYELESLQALISATKKEILSMKEVKEGLSTQWDKVNAEVFKMDADKSCCPSCKRPLENALDIEAELRDNFMKSVNSRKNEINERGISYAEKIKKSEVEVKDLEKDEIEIKAKIVDIDIDLSELLKKDLSEKTDVEFSAEMIELSNNIATFKIPELTPVDTSELKEEKKILQNEIEILTTELAGKLIIEKAKERQEELKASQRSMSSEIASIEAVEMQIEKYNKAEMEFVESRINSKFRVVKFKMFENQLNGGEAPTCICMIDGVPYKDLNKGGEIRAGIDIVNALQNYFQISAPVFIDNKEALTSREQMDFQAISLSAVEGQKTLKVTHKN